MIFSLSVRCAGLPRHCWLATVALLALSACANRGVGDRPDAEGVADVPRVELLRIDRSLDLPDKEATLYVENWYGDITVKTSDDDSVGIYALAQLIEPAPLTPELEVTSTAGALRVAVRYPGFDEQSPLAPRRARTDLGVFVPAGRRVALRTSYGSIKAKALHSPLQAQSASGRIVVGSFETLQLESRSGSIFGALLAPACSKPVRANSESGDIRFQLPLHAAVAVQAYALAVVADFPLHQPEHARASFSAGRTDAPCRVELRAESGKIELYGQPE